jgi:hypothetical protein
LAVSGEEEGLLGSHEYAKDAYNNGDNIVGVFNADMIGNAENEAGLNNMKIYSNTASQWLLDFAEDISDEYWDYLQLNVIPSGYSGGSDHASFWQYGFDALFYHEYQFSPHWHQPSDTIENMNITYCTKNTKFLIASLGEIAQVQISNYPPENLTLYGDTTGYEGEGLTFSFSADDPEGDDIYFLLDWGDGTNSGWYGPYATGETGEAINSWDTIGDYEVKVKARDTNNRVSDWSDPMTVTIVDNLPPDKPDMSAFPIGTTGNVFELTISADDFEGHDVLFYISWGDGNIEYWFGPYASGEDAIIEHTYTEGGKYNIVAMAKDEYEQSGQQSQISVFIIKDRAIINPIFQKILERFPILERLILFLI